jgi:ribosomal protein S18 acetylase RimI-like enzyme
VIRAAMAVVFRYHRWWLIERDVSLELPETASAGPLEYRVCTAADLPLFRSVRSPWRVWRRIFLDRWHRGQLCIACLDSSAVAGYVWIARTPERDRMIGIKIVPGVDESYGFDLYVKPEYRRRGVAFSLISLWLRDARALGKRRATGIVLDSNTRMLMATILGFGFRRVRRFASIELLGRYGVCVHGSWNARQTLGP